MSKAAGPLSAALERQLQRLGCGLDVLVQVDLGGGEQIRRGVR